MNQHTDYIQIAALNQYAYCPHRCWRMFCAGEFTDNQYTIEGTALHDRVHTISHIQAEGTEQIRAIYLKSEQYKLIGKSDLVEIISNQYYPIEYKRGNKGEWHNDELQVCAQALCLEEMTGQTINRGYIYYAHSHQRQPVEINQHLRQTTINTIGAVSNLLATGKTPKPTYSKRCQGCSLFMQCLPKATDKLKTYQEPD
ncbi:CRISPR-associated protein Cas4 [Chrysosporum bergii ANA360D]|jgi:CRISPR-associated exonuclease Cas4|uniref:CRISPR-associated exonuclease Cas4 n=1 Tax=Chrysosporum bergii ANA360D TaxID=617107 RepID=A0AA43GQH3_9CYAN|nr:CRISPR-associated protein Cas4 [Chrysosporum bergii]MDH6059163.1 CRISPR-associated protein Cas4 [Chrysosporum bergii ANA360D]